MYISAGVLGMHDLQMAEQTMGYRRVIYLTPDHSETDSWQVNQKLMCARDHFPDLDAPIVVCPQYFFI